MKIFLMLAGISLLTMSSCELLDKTSSDTDIVEGLKTALEVGTDSSVFKTSAINGYFNDAAIKILLPPEANVIEENIQYVNQLAPLKALGIDLSVLVNNTVKSMNKAAESAAKKAGPIFKTSITDLNITDGLTILNGVNPASGTKSSAGFDSTAATNYLISTTRDALVEAYAEPIDAELDKDLGLGFSSNDAWSTMTVNYNKIATTAKATLDADAILGIFGVLSNDQKTMLRKFQPITQTSLGVYVTGKALDGLFLKVGDQERSIRRDPWKWISKIAGDVGDILTKVFGGA
jgi:hypothetical protein